MTFSYWCDWERTDGNASIVIRDYFFVVVPAVSVWLRMKCCANRTRFFCSPALPRWPILYRADTHCLYTNALWLNNTGHGNGVNVPSRHEWLKFSATCWIGLVHWIQSSWSPTRIDWIRVNEHVSYLLDWINHPRRSSKVLEISECIPSQWRALVCLTNRWACEQRMSLWNTKKDQM